MKTEGFKKFDLQGKTALVTGGGEGLGYHMARALAQSGAKVMIVARRENVLREAVEKLKSDPSVSAEVLYRCGDLADRNSVKALADYAIATLKGVDIFVPNAIMIVPQPMDQISPSALDGQIQVNFCSTLELIRAFTPHMCKNNWGRIIIISSAGGVAGLAIEGLSIYGSTKGALNTLAKYVAAEYGRKGITANSLVLGMYASQSQQEIMAEMGERGKAEGEAWVSMTSLGRLGNFEEVEGIVQLLASDAGSYITGAAIPVDGGLTSSLKPIVQLASEQGA